MFTTSQTHLETLLRKQWRLPDPPAGRQWLFADKWTADMLPDGWRPLLKGEREQQGDETFLFSGWDKVCKTETAPEHMMIPRRTRRPLPPEVDPLAEVKAAHKAGKAVEYMCILNKQWRLLPPPPMWSQDVSEYRIKPEPRVVPWTRETCPPLPFEVRNELGDRFTIVSAQKEGYRLAGNSSVYSWQRLKDMFTLRDGSPCGEVVE